MLFRKTTATDKIAALRKRIRGVSGGTSASKTISILIWLIGYAQTEHDKLVSVVSETMPHLRKGAMRDFEQIMRGHGYWDDNRWNKTSSIYTFETGSIIEFFSADQPERIKGARRDVLFVNEANNITLETYTQLEVRTRSIIWLDWNPVSEFWWYTDILPNNDVDFIKLTYKDNEALEPSIVQSIESKRHNRLFWQVYGLGELGEAEGRIYTGWQSIDAVPHEARLERRGLDFGYTNDPTAIISIYYYNGGFILDQELYRKGLSNKAIADVLNNLDKPGTLVVADSAEPKSIDEITSYGVPIIATTKGRDSVAQGIQYVQQQQISMTKRSVDLIKEYRNYLWEVDKDGKIINTPQDYLNHAMDAIRYGFESLKPREYATQPIRTNPLKWRIA